jgi:DNA-binding NarL/FixJ family response regulator
MSFRVREVLLVSSLYDSYILEEDGQLAEGVDAEYYELKLSYTPRITRVSSGAEALAALETRPFDMIITMAHVGEMNVLQFGRAVKEKHPDMPVVLLADTPAEAARVKTEQSQSVKHRHSLDQVFVWRGDLSIFLAIFKYIEDKRNADQDTRLARVRIIILIENSVRFYSSYLPLLFTELMKQNQALMADGVNTTQRLRRMKARTKVLLAETFEEGWEYYEKYRNFTLGIITDARFPREGQSDPQAGLEFVRRVKALDADMPVLIQSSDESLTSKASALGAGFLNKRSPRLLQELRFFLQRDLGFGDFVFRLYDGSEVGRVPDLAAMPSALAKMPEESIRYHALRNHFSNWCMARSEFALASMLRPRKVSEFENIEEIRRYLISAFSQLRDRTQRGVVADFSREEFNEKGGFARIGTGSMGGKGRGLGFINALLTQPEVQERFAEARIFVPPSVVIGTDVFDAFLAENRLSAVALSEAADEEIAAEFLEARMPAVVYEDLRVFVERTHYPLAIRSSSLLEDSHQHAFAGIYKTYMLANNQADTAARLEEICRAIKLVYASTFYRNAKAFLRSTANRMEEEKMAVVLQKLVGCSHDGVFYPDFAGVARSYNYYPVKGQDPAEGVGVAALGLGKTVVDGDRAVRFSPGRPKILLQFSSTSDYLENAQRKFYALDLRKTEPAPLTEREGWVVQLDLDAAEKHGTLGSVGSVYSPDNDAVYDGISRSGVRLVTFAPILKGGAFPLPQILTEMLELGSRHMGFPVEIEFAVNMEPHKDPASGKGGKPEFAFLQIRPMTIDSTAENLDKLLKKIDPELILCTSKQALGHGRTRGIRDVVYVKPDVFDRAKTVEVAAEVEFMNRKLSEQGKPYLLIGPGRWGTADRWLGIPVEWHQISAVGAVVETEMEEISVAPSEGTHFFQNLTTLGIGYFHIHGGEKGGTIDYEWLDGMKAREETHTLRHLRLESPLDIRVDGKSRRGLILKQGV